MSVTVTSVAPLVPVVLIYKLHVRRHFSLVDAEAKLEREQI